MIFKKAKFIKPNDIFKREFSDNNPSSLFFRRFNLDNGVDNAKLKICALGIGYCYVNGKKVSEDLFAAPPSDYEKRLWYMQYEIGSLLKNGENVIAILCGNGFLNEDMENAWASTNVAWRDFPKVIAEISIEDEVVLSTDETWKSSLNSPYLLITVSSTLVDVVPTLIILLLSFFAWFNLSATSLDMKYSSLCIL